MPPLLRIAVAASLALCACTRAAALPVDRTTTNAGIDSLNARISQAYRAHDPKAYAALFTDTAVFEWPAFYTVRGALQLDEMARGNQATLSDMDLVLHVAARRLDADHATEFGALQQPYRYSTGARATGSAATSHSSLGSRTDDGCWIVTSASPTPRDCRLAEAKQSRNYSARSGQITSAAPARRRLTNRCS